MLKERAASITNLSRIVALAALVCLASLAGVLAYCSSGNAKKVIFDDELVGGSPGMVSIHASGQIVSIDSGGKTLEISKFERAIEEYIGLSTITVDCKNPYTMEQGLSFDQLSLGQKVKIRFGWPQDASLISGIIYLL